MIKRNNVARALLGTGLAAMVAASFAATTATPAAAQPVQSGGEAYRPQQEVILSIGEGELITLPRNVADVWTSNSAVADVNVNNPRQIGLFGKEAGESTVIATAADGSIVYGARVRVSQNLSSVNEMLSVAMPDSDITVTSVGQIAVINGTVASPEDAAQAEMLVGTILNPGVDVSQPGAALKILPVNRLKVATPLQVMLQVKIAEVSRSLMKDIGVNITSQDRSGGDTGFVFGRGRDFGEFNETGGFTFEQPDGGSGVGLRLTDILGIDIAGMIDANETSGLVTTLAEPTLVALSGETASFLAGGEFPIPTAQGINGTSVEFKEYGVSLAFTPTVLDGGRISMRVRPEVSELSSAGSIRLNGFEVPSLTTRRTETTVELGSGQSFMIGGLLSNGGNNSVERTPFLGSLPILGALFRSNGFRRNQTELVIVITPYLVKPVNASQIALPTDGFRSANDPQRLLLDRESASRSGEARPGPVMAPPRTVAPGLTIGANEAKPAAPAVAAQSSAAKPGFSF